MGLLKEKEHVCHRGNVLVLYMYIYCSTYLSFMRQSLKQLYSELAEKGGEGRGMEGDVRCGIPRQPVVKDVNVFRQSDSFRGLLVTLKDSEARSLNSPEFEVFFSPVSHFKRFEVDGDLAKRVTGLEVSTTSWRCA